MKKKYIAPQTDLLEVELENGFMNASVVKDNDDGHVEIKDQTISGNYDFTNDDPWN